MLCDDGICKKIALTADKNHRGYFSQEYPAHRPHAAERQPNLLSSPYLSRPVPSLRLLLRFDPHVYFAH